MKRKKTGAMAKTNGILVRISPTILTFRYKRLLINGRVESTPGTGILADTGGEERPYELVDTIPTICTKSAGWARWRDRYARGAPSQTASQSRPEAAGAR